MPRRKTAPPRTDAEWENQLISLALKQAQNQMEEGTASSQVLTHFLRLGSKRADVELKKLELESRLIEEKIASEQKGQQVAEMMTDVLDAIRSYSYIPPSERDVDL